MASFSMATPVYASTAIGLKSCFFSICKHGLLEADFILDILGWRLIWKQFGLKLIPVISSCDTLATATSLEFSQMTFCDNIPPFFKLEKMWRSGEKTGLVERAWPLAWPYGMALPLWAGGWQWGLALFLQFCLSLKCFLQQTEHRLSEVSVAFLECPSSPALLCSLLSVKAGK
jgi:hypothetical protein